MNIIEVNHKFNGVLKNRISTKRIVIHHSAGSDVGAATIHQWHLNNSWLGIGYHYVIRTNGNIERGRPEIVVGSHAGPNGNSDSIGICLTGHLSKYPPSEAQIKSLVWLINDIQKRYGKLEIVGHEKIMPTDCPGKLFPWDRLFRDLQSNNINNNVSNITPDNAVKLLVNGKDVDFPVRLVNGRTEAFVSDKWITVRDLSNLLKAELQWDANTRTANLIIK